MLDYTREYKPSEIAFVINEDDIFGDGKMTTTIAIVAIEHFEHEGHMYDGGTGIGCDAFHDNFSELAEDAFETELSIDNAKELLLKLGFKQHEGFTQFMNR